MHKSKLAGFIIDCQTTDLAEAAGFWGAALGMQTRPFADAEGEKYTELLDPTGALHVEVQRVDHPSRVHLDIETDDIPAEVQRLESLGAKKIGEVASWCVMEAPTGQRFCVVEAVLPGFADNATTWP